MLDRLTNIFFLFALIFVFILFGDAHEHIRILIAVFLAFVFTVIAFILNWITKDGAVAAALFGIYALGLGGLTGAAVVLAFFISGSLLSKNYIMEEGYQTNKFRRNGKQVWSNGFWFALWILLWAVFGVEVFLIASIASIAMATSDTWATEIGDTRFKGKTWLITTGKKVTPGTDGGISFPGTIAAIFGAIFISIVYWIFKSDPELSKTIIIGVSGFFGCTIDSYLGAKFQHTELKFSLPSLKGTLENVKITNDMVNWISTGIASLFCLIIILIIDL